MDIYNFIILPIFFGVILTCFNNKINGIFTIIVMIVIYMIISLRGLDVDRDSHVYYMVFNNLSSIKFSELFLYSKGVGQEIGFIFLMKIGNYIGLDFFEFRFLYNFICLISLIYILFGYIKQKYRLISYMIYVSMFVLFRDFTQIRLSLSCLLALISILKALDRKNIQSVSFLFLSILFHNTALICIPVIIFLMKYKDSEVIYSPYFVVIIILSGSLFYVLSPINYLLSLDVMPSQITRYEGTKELSSSGTFGIGFFISIIISFLLSLKYRSCDIEDDYRALYITMLFSTFASLVFVDFPILMRMQILLFTGVIFLPSVIYEYFIKKEVLNNIIFQIIISSIFCAYFYKVLASGIVFQYGVY